MLLVGLNVQRWTERAHREQGLRWRHCSVPCSRRTAELVDSYSDTDLLVIHDFLVAARQVITEHAEAVQQRGGASPTT
jgi:hypothetical protein